MALECQRLSLTKGSVTAQVSWFGRPLETSPEAAEGHGRHRSARGIATVGGTFALLTVSLPGMNARQAGTALVGSDLAPGAAVPRSEERRVGKECVRTCRSRGATYHSTK